MYLDAFGCTLCIVLLSDKSRTCKNPKTSDMNTYFKSKWVCQGRKSRINFKSFRVRWCRERSLNPSFHTPAIPLVSLHRLRLDQCSLSPSGLNEDTGILVYSFFSKKCQADPQAHLAATKLQSSWIIFVLKHLQKRLQVLAAPKQADVFSKFNLKKNIIIYIYIVLYVYNVPTGKNRGNCCCL